MHNCKYCDRELKSKAGMIRHESACKARDIGGQTEDKFDEDGNNMSYMIDDDFAIPEPTVVQLEVMNGAETYYMGHPRRATKLKGMLSATFDRAERHKIQQLIMKVENETYKG